MRAVHVPVRHLFLVNPVAGGRDRTDEVRAEAARLFPDGGFEVRTTAAPGDAQRIVAAAAEYGGEVRVYCCGGDGTLNECINGAAYRPNCAVGVCPSGTGNDFVRLFGAERRRFLSLRELVCGEVRPLDLIACAGRYGLGVCSVGIDARIGTQVHRYTGLPLVGRKLGYIVSAAVNLARGVNQPLRVECGGEVFDGPAALVCCCNGAYYGGGFHPLPQARPDDGALDFIIVRGVSRLTFLRLVGKYAAGRTDELPADRVSVRRGDFLHVSSPQPLCVNIDGEAQWSAEVDFQLCPSAVRFIFPRGLKYFDCKPEISGDNQSKTGISQKNAG